MAERTSASDSGDSRRAAEQVTAWLDEFGDDVFAYARRRVEDELIAEEIVQDTFVAAWKNLDSFEGRSSPKTWLIAILRNKLIGHYRQRSRDRRQPLDQDATSQVFDDHGIWNIPVGRWPGRPDDEMQQEEFWEAFDDCLSKLPANAAEVFVLRVLDGLETENICKTLEISSSNLAVRLHRARMALRNCLENSWFGDN